MTSDINVELSSDEINELCSLVNTKINRAENDTQLITKAAILEIYWGCGETLNKMHKVSKEELTNFCTAINDELKDDPLLGYSLIKVEGLELAKMWVNDHKNDAQEIILSGLISWEEWTLLLETVKSAPHRYWLACQSIKQEWDQHALQQAIQSLPKEYLIGKALT